MISNQILQNTIDGLKGITRIDLCIIDTEGKVLAATFQDADSYVAAALAFVESPADSQVFLGCQFFKVFDEHQLEYILLANGDSDDVYMVGKIASFQIQNLLVAYKERFDKDNFVKNLLLDNLLLVDIYNRAKKLHIEAAQRVVFVIEVSGKKDGVVMETVKNLFASSTVDFITEVDEKSVILVKDVREIPTEAGLANLAEVIVDNLQTEAMVKVRVGYGNRVEMLQDIARSYQEARMALEVGSIFYVEANTISYANLGIGRLIYQIPISLCEMFLQEVFGEKIPEMFDEETTITINKFFENNLNISETARQLYVHRNTLVYRLERIEKALGLDIRTFEDAMLFKIALMVISNMNYQKGAREKEKEEKE